MKSLMEEASSISKAIENGWTNAGKPKEFTVKVYEEPKKNFFGLTSSPARIGIFFAEPKSAEPRRKPRPATQEARKPQEARQPREVRESRPKKETEDLGPIWEDGMIESANEWIGEILKHIGVLAPYKVNPSRFHLRIEFENSVLEDKDRQKHLFAILSGLLMTMLKRKYKRPLRGYKIVLTET